MTARRRRCGGSTTQRANSAPSACWWAASPPAATCRWSPRCACASASVARSFRRAALPPRIDRPDGIAPGPIGSHPSEAAAHAGPPGCERAGGVGPGLGVRRPRAGPDAHHRPEPLRLSRPVDGGRDLPWLRRPRDSRELGHLRRGLRKRSGARREARVGTGPRLRPESGRRRSGVETMHCHRTEKSDRRLVVVARSRRLLNSNNRTGCIPGMDTCGFS